MRLSFIQLGKTFEREIQPIYVITLIEEVRFCPLQGLQWAKCISLSKTRMRTDWHRYNTKTSNVVDPLILVSAKIDHKFLS